jgi:trans-aconitate methyltransferase
MPGSPRAGVPSALVRDRLGGSSATARDRDDWEQHWREYAGSAADNPAQDFRRRLILKLLRPGSDSERRRFVDIGSGTGELAEVLLAAYPEAELIGLELSHAGVEHARRRVPQAVFLQRDLTVGDPPPPEYRSWATHAVCSEVLEHVDDPRRLLDLARAYLAPGCSLVVTVPGGPMTAYDRHIGHRRHFRTDELAELLRASGFELVRATGAGFPVFNLYRLLMWALGDRLARVAGASERSAPVRAAMGLFGLLLRANVRLSGRGWQIVAVARIPDAPAPEPHV